MAERGKDWMVNARVLLRDCLRRLSKRGEGFATREQERRET